MYDESIKMAYDEHCSRRGCRFEMEDDEEETGGKKKSPKFLQRREGTAQRALKTCNWKDVIGRRGLGQILGTVFDRCAKVQ
jgi:hypothetical protein